MIQDILPINAASSYTGARLRVIDSTDGTPETTFAYNTTGIDLWYCRQGGARVAITEATLAAVDSAYSSGGVIHISDGYVRLDLPDAALATGATFVDFGGTATGMVIIGGRIKLTAGFSLADAVRAGLTALPNAAAEAAGGLYTRGTGAGQIAQDANGNARVNVDTIKTQAVTCAAGVTVLASVGTAATAVAQSRDLTDAVVAGAVWGADATTYQAAGTFGLAIGDPAADAAGGLYKGVVTDAAGLNVAVDIVAVKADTAAILLDTGTDGVVLPQAQADKVWGTAARVLTAGTNIALAKGTGLTGLNDIAASDVTTALGTGSDLTALATAAAVADLHTDLATVAGYVDTEIGTLTTELAKVPKSDSNVTWNATALGSINAEVDTALNTAIPGSPTSDSINERVVAIDAYGAPPAATAIWAAAARTLTAGTNIALAKGVGLTGLNDIAAADVVTAIGTGSGLTALATQTSVNTIDGIVDTMAATVAKVETTLVADGAVSQFTANALELAPTGGSAPTVGQIADAVWDEVLHTAHEVADSASVLLQAAGTASDPWLTALPGAYGAGTAGRIMGRSLPDAVAGAASGLALVGSAMGVVASVAGAVGSVTGMTASDVNAIKLKTDTLPASPAAVGSNMGSVASVTAGVTVTTNNDKTGYTVSTVSDKTGYALSTGGVAAVWAYLVEGAWTTADALRGLLAMLIGKASGAGTVTFTLRDASDTKNRVVATVDGLGNRSALSTTDLT